jgi:hypothetical protein
LRVFSKLCIPLSKTCRKQGWSIFGTREEHFELLRREDHSKIPSQDEAKLQGWEKEVGDLGNEKGPLKDQKEEQEGVQGELEVRNDLV